MTSRDLLAVRAMAKKSCIGLAIEAKANLQIADQYTTLLYRVQENKIYLVTETSSSRHVEIEIN